MNKFKRLSALLLVITGIFALASCSGKIKNLHTNLIATPKRDKIAVVVKFEDSEKRVYNDFTPSVYLYETDEKGKQADQKDFETLTTDDKNEVVTESDEVIFDGLEVDKTYIVKVVATYEGYKNTLAEERVVTTSEGSDKETAKEIHTVEDFLDIKYDRGGHFKLMNHLDFEGKEIPSMFTTESKAFTGGIYGEGHTIKNFVVTDASNQYSGLIGYNKGIIENLTIENASISASRTSEMNMGLLVGTSAGRIENVTIKDSKVEANSSAYSLTYPLIVGGLVGNVDSNERVDAGIINCRVYSTTITVNAVHRATVGGMIGKLSQPSRLMFNPVIKDNIAETTINVTQENKTDTTDNIEIYVGGFVGHSARNFENCIAKSDITVKATKKAETKIGKGYTVSVGGFAGVTKENTIAQFKDVLFTGSIVVDAADASTLYVGGLIGLANSVNIINGASKLTKFDIKSHNLVATPTADDTEEGGENEGTPAERIYFMRYSSGVAHKGSDVKLTNVGYYGTELDATVTGSIVNVTADKVIDDSFSQFIKDYLSKN